MPPPSSQKSTGRQTTTASQTLPVGTPIDRFGLQTGSFISPNGARFKSRATPYICKMMDNRVIEDILREAGGYNLPVPRFRGAEVPDWFYVADGGAGEWVGIEPSGSGWSIY
jgi:hypothetical protein